MPFPEQPPTVAERAGSGQRGCKRPRSSRYLRSCGTAPLQECAPAITFLPTPGRRAHTPRDAQLPKPGPQGIHAQRFPARAAPSCTQAAGRMACGPRGAARLRSSSSPQQQPTALRRQRLQQLQRSAQLPLLAVRPAAPRGPAHLLVLEPRDTRAPARCAPAPEPAAADGQPSSERQRRPPDPSARARHACVRASRVCCTRCMRAAPIPQVPLPRKRRWQ